MKRIFVRYALLWILKFLDKHNGLELEGIVYNLLKN